MKPEDPDPYSETIERLFRAHYRSLRAYAVRYVYDVDIAEDIVQDVFMELWKKQTLMKPHLDAGSYLFRSVYNRSINYLNSKSHRSKISLGPTDILEDYLMQVQATQDDNLMDREISREIEVAVGNLPPQCRKVFLLSRTYNLKNREVAEQLDISVKSVEKHISKAISHISDYLKRAGILLLLSLLCV